MFLDIHTPLNNSELFCAVSLFLIYLSNIAQSSPPVTFTLDALLLRSINASVCKSSLLLQTAAYYYIECIATLFLNITSRNGSTTHPSYHK